MLDLSLLGVDENLVILSFLDVTSLCNLNCVSKSFCLSQLSNCDVFWKSIYKKTTEQFTLSTVEERNNNLKSKTKDFKIALIEFYKSFILPCRTVQRQRLENMNFDKNMHLLGMNEMLEKKSEILSKFTAYECHTIKIVVSGETGVGKTSLLIVLSESSTNINNLEYIPTVFGCYSYNLRVDTQYSFPISFCDTAGDNEYEKLRVLGYENTNVFVLCYSVADLYTFERISSKWILELRHHCPKTPIILCACKTDLREDKRNLFKLFSLNNCVPISREEGKTKAKEVKADGFIETSSLTGKGFEKTLLYISLWGLLELSKEVQIFRKNYNGRVKNCFLQ